MNLFALCMFQGATNTYQGYIYKHTHGWVNSTKRKYMWRKVKCTSQSVPPACAAVGHAPVQAKLSEDHKKIWSCPPWSWKYGSFSFTSLRLRQFSTISGWWQAVWTSGCNRGHEFWRRWRIIPSGSWQVYLQERLIWYSNQKLGFFLFWIRIKKEWFHKVYKNKRSKCLR